jgi:hypothetical protein
VVKLSYVDVDIRTYVRLQVYDMFFPSARLPLQGELIGCTKGVFDIANGELCQASH